MITTRALNGSWAPSGLGCPPVLCLMLTQMMSKSLPQLDWNADLASGTKPTAETCQLPITCITCSFTLYSILLQATPYLSEQNGLRGCLWGSFAAFGVFYSKWNMQQQQPQAGKLPSSNISECVPERDQQCLRQPIRLSFIYWAVLYNTSLL